MSRRRGCGCGLGIVLALIMVIAIVGWSLSFFGAPNPIRQLQPVPYNNPPLAGAEVPQIDIHTGGRVSDKLSFWAEPIAHDTGIPEAALRAYGYAELVAADMWPECGIHWTTLAGIGKVETKHGTYTGKLFSSAEINDNGVVDPPIVGIQLDGSEGVADIPDTDNGEWDGDTEHDRALGPMQFIPETWRNYAIDGNGDGILDPHQIDDAAVTAADLLCASGGDLSSEEGWTQAVHAYNASQEYLINVRDAANSYAIRQPA